VSNVHNNCGIEYRSVASTDGLAAIAIKEFGMKMPPTMVPLQPHPKRLAMSASTTEVDSPTVVSHVEWLTAGSALLTKEASAIAPAKGREPDQSRIRNLLRSNFRSVATLNACVASSLDTAT
jgi:hypothetical protein